VLVVVEVEASCFTTSLVVHSNATKRAARIAVRPIRKNIDFLPSKSAFGFFFISIY
jgi:hypothetical protein